MSIPISHPKVFVSFLLHFIIGIVFLFYVQCISDNEMQNHVKELRKELFKNRGYDVMARPVRNYTHPVNVSIYLDINYIKSLDINTNILESEGWVRLSWTDENLKWKPQEYGGLDEIRVNLNEVYRPDVTIINSVDTENLIRTTTHSDMILWYNGEIFWMPALSMKTVCDVDMTNWPFDRQTCVYRFASWTHDGNALDLQNASNKIDLTSFTENPEWNVIDSKCEYKTYLYTEEGFYPEVVYYLTIERKVTVYRYVIYLPVICALMLNLMALFLDVRNILRFHLSIVCFGTLLAIVLYLGSKLGFGSLGTPNVVKYLGQMIVITSITLLWFAFSINFIKSSFEVPSSFVKVIEPVQHWLVSNDVEAVQLTNTDPEDGSTGNKQQQKSHSQTNFLVVQVIDKVLFVLFLILMIALHN